MVIGIKKFLFVIVAFVNILYAQNVFERNCVACHKKLSATLQEMFKRYLLVYSSETNMKMGIKHYLKYPLKDISSMSQLFVETYGIKAPTTLSKKELNEAVDIYWEKYKVFGKLK